MISVSKSFRNACLLPLHVHVNTAAIIVSRMLAVAGMAITVAAVAAVPARAAAEGTGLTPRAGEWWMTTWKMLPKVWPLAEGAGVTVAVIDTGVQASVPDLRGAVLPGGDVTGHRTDGETGFNGHGTEMAVLIAGQGYGTGMLGMAPKAKILPVVVNAEAADVTSDPGSMAAGIIYAVNHGASVIDVSQEYPSASASGCDPAEQKAVAYAVAHNVIVVAAAGDTNLIGAAPAEPASCIGVLAVAALEPNRVLWPKDARQPYLTLVNPGADLISSGPDGRLISGVSGTRAASALAAGAVALIRSRYPALPWYRVIQRLTGTALQEGGPVPNDSFGYGILRLSHAIDATAYPVPASAPNPVYAKYQAWLATPQGRSVSGQLDASSSTGQGGGSATRALVVIMALLAAAGTALLLTRNRRPAAPRRQGGQGLRAKLSEAAFPDTASGQEDSQQASVAPDGTPDGYVLFGDQPPYRIPPYVSAPDQG
jgi:hypothetical protein